MAQQFVTNPVAPSAQDNLDLLYTNLAENVAYRRAKQQMKAAQKQDLELKMAQGLIPKANITVTDEGFAFEGEDTLGSQLLGTERRDTSAARQAFWEAVGAPERGADMSREGFTNVLEQQIPGQKEAFAAMVEQARRAADETLSPEERNLAQQNYANASAMLGSVASRPSLTEQPDDVIPTIPIPQPQPQPQPNDPFYQTGPVGGSTPLSMPSAANIGSAASVVGSTTATPPPPPPSPTSLGSMMANRLAKQGPIPAKPAAPAAPTTTEDKATSASEKVQQGGKIAEMGQVEVGIKRGGFDVQMANVATKTTQVQSAQIDEIKRSIPRLAGLAALENYGNQLMQTRGYNTGAPMQDTFSSLLNQRVKDIARWEEAATKSGTSRTLEKLDPFKMEVKPTELDLKVTRKGELKADTRISASFRGGDTQAPLSGGVYSYQSASDKTKRQSVEANDRGFLLRPTTDIAYNIGPNTSEYAGGPEFFEAMKSKVAQQVIPGLEKWEVLATGDPKNPTSIVLKSPDGRQRIQWIQDKNVDAKKGGRWTLSASENTNVAALQYFTGNSFTRDKAL